MQTKLKSLGYYTGKVDGIYGTGTQSAVKKFQKNCGITVDGIAGPKTLLYLGITNSGRFLREARENIARVISTSSRV